MKMINVSALENNFPAKLMLKIATKPFHPRYKKVAILVSKLRKALSYEQRYKPYLISRTFATRKSNPLDLDFHFPVFHIPQSERHVLDQFAIVPDYAAFTTQAVFTVWLNSINNGTSWEILQLHLHALQIWFDVYLHIPHFVINSECIFIIHSLQKSKGKSNTQNPLCNKPSA